MKKEPNGISQLVGDGKIIGVKRLGEALNLNPQTIRSWIPYGLPFERMGYFYVFSVQAVQAWIDENRRK